MKIKSLCLVAFILAIVAAGYGQAKPATSDKAKTDLETFQEKYGSVVINAYSKMPFIPGSGGYLTIYIKEFRSPTTPSKTKGLLIEINSAETYGGSGSARSFVEFAEIDSLIKGIQYISKIDKSITTLDNFEAQYRTKDDFTVIVFNAGTKDGKFNVSLQVGTYGAKSMYIALDKLPGLIQQLETAKAKLDAL